MGTIMRSRRALAAILIVIVAVSVTGVSTYALMNNQKFSQQNYLLSLLLFTMGQPRIVSLAPSITEMVFGLGLGDYLVGCTTLCDYPPRLYELISTGKVANSLDYSEPNLESVLALNPSIVLVDTGVKNQEQLLVNLISRGIFSFPVSKGETFFDIETSIMQLGSMFGRSSAAQTLVDAMNTKINTVNNSVYGQQAPNVLFALWINFGEEEYITTCASNTFLNEIINLAGGSNIFYDVYDPRGFFDTGFYDVGLLDPEIMIFSASYLTPTTVLQKIMEDPNLSNTPAFYNGKIYFVQQQADNIFMRPGPRVAEAVEVLAHLLHPGVFNETIPLMGFTLNNLNYQDYLSSLIPMG